MQTKIGKKVVAALASHFRMIQNSGQKVDILMHHKRGDVGGKSKANNATSGAGGNSSTPGDTSEGGNGTGTGHP